MEQRAAFLTEYDWLINSHGIRFVTDNLGALIPTEWVTYLETLSERELFLLYFSDTITPPLPSQSSPLSSSSAAKSPMPASLRRFLQECRQAGSSSAPPSADDSDIAPPKLYSGERDIPPIADSDLALFFAKGMSPKKWHEVHRMAELVYQMSLRTGCRSVVDLGCGQGYLMQVLAFYYKLDVLGVDSSAHQTAGAVKRAASLQLLLKSWAKNNPTIKWESIDLAPVFMTLVCPVHSQMTMAELRGKAQAEYDEQQQQRERVDDDCGDHSLRNNKNTNKPSTYTTTPFREPVCHPLLSGQGVIVVGLHTCGDLAPTTLKLFYESETVKGLVSVGCCYNLMTEVGEQSIGTKTSSPPTLPSVGFPISMEAQRLKQHLGRMARVLACQSLQKRLELSNDDSAISRVHTSQCFRAVLQVIYERVLGVHSNVYTGEFSPEYLASFPIYAKHVLEKVSIPHQLTEADLEQIWCEHSETTRKQIIIFDSLRVCIAPVIEEYIMDDRRSFIKEQNQSRQAAMPQQEWAAFPLFDARISPRNTAFVLLK